MAVHAAGAEQAENVQGAVRALDRRAGAEQRGVGQEAAIGDRGVDARQVLIDDAPGADVHVADFRIAHLAVRQADVQPVRFDQRVRALGQ